MKLSTPNKRRVGRPARWARRPVPMWYEGEDEAPAPAATPAAGLSTSALDLERLDSLDSLPAEDAGESSASGGAHRAANGESVSGARKLERRNSFGRQLKFLQEQERLASPPPLREENGVHLPRGWGSSASEPSAAEDGSSSGTTEWTCPKPPPLVIRHIKDLDSDRLVPVEHADQLW